MLLREGTGIPCGRGEDGSFWNRLLRGRDWRAWKEGGGESRVAVEGLRMLENQLWTAEAGDESEGEVGTWGVSDLVRLCLVDLVRISPLMLSTALDLLKAKQTLRVVVIYRFPFEFWRVSSCGSSNPMG